jgi:L-malate glycosyltransferase
LIHTDAPRETAYSFLAAKLFGRKAVFHARVSDSFLWLDKILYCLADRIIVVSFAVAQRFEFVKKQDKIKVVYNSVELEVFKPPAEPKENKENFVLGYFGRIDRRKCIETAINAVKSIKGEIELVIMGQGDDQYLEELKLLADDKRIIFKPYKNNIVEDISRVDAVVLPSSKGEGMPRIIIEAMALGKAVIVSDVPPHSEILGEELQEFVFPVRDELKLKEIIERLMEGAPAFFKQKELMRMKANELFDINKNTKLIEDIYEECAFNQAS